MGKQKFSECVWQHGDFSISFVREYHSSFVAVFSVPGRTKQFKIKNIEYTTVRKARDNRKSKSLNIVKKKKKKKKIPLGVLLPPGGGGFAPSPQKLYVALLLLL